MTLSTMRFTQAHEWLRPDEEDPTVVTVGITSHAAEQLGDVVFVELPEPPATVAKDDEVAVIESVKAASEILAPVDGEVLEVNEALADNPGQASEDPMGEGWFFIMKIADADALAALMTEAAYKAHIGE